MASGTISLLSHDSPPSSPRIPRVPIAGKDASSMETHRLIQKKAKELADVDAPSLQGRVSTPTTPEKKQKSWADLSSSGENFEGSGDDSGSTSGFNSSFSTPSPVKIKKELTTPEALQALETVMASQDPGFDLTPSSDKTMRQAVEKLDDLNSPYRSQQKARVRGSFSAALVRNGSTEIPSPLVQRRLFSTSNPADISGKWTAVLAKSLDVNFLDEMHIKDLEDEGGFHVCPAEHPRDASVKYRRINLLTGVWCGKIFDLDDPQKVVKSFSSFVPRDMTLKRYQVLIAEAQGNDEREIARQGNRRLYEVVDGKNRFMIECYLKFSETLIRSPIPIFHYEIYEGTEKSFEVDYSFKLTRDGDDPQKQMTYTVFYETLFELLPAKPHAIVYNTDEKIIVDLGLLFGKECPIDKGLLVEISKEFLI